MNIDRLQAEAMLYRRFGSKYIRFVFLVVAIFILLSSLGTTTASSYYNLILQSQTTISPPEVTLQEGTVGTSTIYANSTSALISVTSPIYDFVDINTGDLDSITDKGAHSNFPAQQAGPDSIYDTLTEENTEAIEDYVDNNTSDVDNSDDEGTLSNFDNMKTKDGMATLTEVSETVWLWQEDTSGYTSTSSYETVQFWSSWTTNSTTSGTITKIGIYVFADPGNSPQVKLGIYDDSGGSPNNLLGETNAATITEAGWLDLDIVGGGVNISASTTYHVAHITDIAPTTQWRYLKTATPVSDYEYGRVWPNLFDPAGTTTKSSTYRYGAYRVGYEGTSDYKLDQEVQFTNVIDFLPTEKLCIYTGTLGDEDLRVDYWNGTGWENLAIDLTAYSCNEYTVSLTSTNFTIRFKDGTTSGDTTQDQWQIDASLLRVEGAGSKEDAVDQQSDVDSSPDVGTHSNFTAQQYGPDLINDTLTEWNTGGASNTTLINAESFEGAWPPTGWTETAFSNWNQESNYAYDGTYSADFDGAFGDPSGYLTTPAMDCSDASAIYVDFWWYDNGLDLDDFELEYYDGSVWDNYQDLDALESGNGWHHYTEKITDNQYFISNFQIRWWANTVSNFETGCVDLVAVKKEIQNADNYELDLEVHWIDLPYSLPNETLCIYAGTMGAEDIKVDVWNGTGWENVFNDLSAGWNNQSITDWLTTSNFTIRFKGGTETGDTNQDTWQIDIALIHVWHEGGENYELDLEIQWVSADYTRPNEELCIKTGTFTGSENIQVRVWNSTGSSWDWIMNLTANQWNNVSITSYLTSSTFTVQFLGGTETDDTSQDSWNIDATLLHVWTSGESFDYVLKVNNTVTDSWQIRLKKYDDSNIDRLQNFTIYFYNSTDGTSSQISIQDGSYINQTGPWYDLGGSETIYIAMTVQANSTGTSYISTYLEVRKPGTTIYAQYVITFEIT